MIIGSRIKERLDEIRKKQADLAREIGVSPQAVSKMVTGGTTDTSKLYKIARFLKTTPEYLTGEIDDPGGASPGVADRQAGFRGAEPQPTGDTVYVDVIDLRAGLGGSYVDGAVTAQKSPFSRAFLRYFTPIAPEHLIWAPTVGNSMEPTIRSGEPVLIDKSDTTPSTDDDIWFCAHGDVVMLKRLRLLPDGGIEILSDNPVVPPHRAYDGELHVIGRVAAVVRRL